MENNLPDNTAILKGHGDEVWCIAWSHDGAYLASGGRDKSAIIWHKSAPLHSGSVLLQQESWSTLHVLGGHSYPIGSLAWSPDDSMLITTTEHIIKLWNTKTGVSIRTFSFEVYAETVTAISWLPDGSGFISGSLDGRVVIWETDGTMRYTVDNIGVRITNLALRPDSMHLVVLSFMDTVKSGGTEASVSVSISGGRSNNHDDDDDDDEDDTMSAKPGQPSVAQNKMIIFDVEAKATKSSFPLTGIPTSLQLSEDLQHHALVNQCPDMICLCDIQTGQVIQKYTGHCTNRHVIQSRFGGVDNRLVISGSEDSKIYIWNRETGALLGALSGHGEGSVNAVAWDPKSDYTFASCSDDHSVRIWELAPTR